MHAVGGLQVASSPFIWSGRVRVRIRVRIRIRVRVRVLVCVRERVVCCASEDAC